MITTMTNGWRCVNCDRPVRGGAGTRGRGRDTGWFLHCPACAELGAAQMVPLDLLPADGRLDVYQCVRCAGRRVCRKGWRTRCHVCLDERSAGPALAAGARLLSRTADPALVARAREYAGDPLSVRAAAEFCAALALERYLDRYRRDGWTVVATDVHGLPWYGQRMSSSSHGTWGSHDTCQTLQKLAPGRLRCVVCQEGATGRTFAELRDTPYLLYLVRHRGLLKFGVGGERRIRQHLAAGATVLTVLEGRHGDVIEAETHLKRQKGDATVPLWFWRKRRMPDSFGCGTEVVGARVIVDLAAVLPKGVNVTHRFE